MTPALQALHLHKNFRGFKATNNVSLAVEEGEIHAVIRPNGAGKTTLFNPLSGFLKPSSGEVRLFGERVDTLSPQLLVRRGLARSFQISSVFSSMTVRENLAVALQAATPLPPRFWVSERVLARFDPRIDEIVAQVGLGIGLLFETDVTALGQDAYAGAIATVPWFWNMDALTRVWAGRFEKAFGKKPTWEQAGDYSATTQYLNAVVRAGGDNGEAVVKALEGHRFNDFYARDAYIRPQDHRVTLNVYTVQVKSKAEAKEPGDYFKRTAIIPAAKAFTPLSESRCKMQ